jgi:hypothetical protein
MKRMARIRSVHPELFLDEAFVELSMVARVLAIGLWTQADDRGIFEWKPSRFKMTIFPNDTVELPQLLSELEAQNCIKKFEIDGRSYGAVRNFCLFQRPRMPSYRHPFPEFCNSYVAFDRRKDVSLPQDCGSPNTALTQPISSIVENRPHRRGEERRGEENLKLLLYPWREFRPATTKARRLWRRKLSLRFQSLLSRGCWEHRYRPSGYRMTSFAMR